MWYLLGTVTDRHTQPLAARERFCFYMFSPGLKKVLSCGKMSAFLECKLHCELSASPKIMLYGIHTNFCCELHQKMFTLSHGLKIFKKNLIVVKKYFLGPLHMYRFPKGGNISCLVSVFKKMLNMADLIYEATNIHAFSWKITIPKIWIGDNKYFLGSCAQYELFYISVYLTGKLQP